MAPPAPRPASAGLRRRGAARRTSSTSPRSRAWPAWWSGPWPTAAAPCPADRPGRPLRSAARLLRPAAPLVPRSARPRQPRLQHSHRRPPGGPARRRGPPPCSWPRSSAATRSSAPPSPTRAASRARSSPTRSSCPCPSRTCPASPRSIAGRALERVHAEAARPFDLARGPLVRAGLIRLGEEEHIVLVTMHHIVSDGWSLGVLIRELSALYEAFHRGEPSPLPEPAIQYVDFAAWQRGWLQGEALQAAARLLDQPARRARRRWSCPPTGPGPPSPAVAAASDTRPCPGPPSTRCAPSAGRRAPRCS